MGRRLREVLIVSLLLMLFSQFYSNVFAQQDVDFSRDLGLTESFNVHAEFFSQNILVTEVLREASVYLAERFVYTDVFDVNSHAVLMDLSIRENIGLKLDNYRFSLSLDGLSFSESILESIERVSAVGGIIISQVPIKNFITFLALLVGCIGLFFIVQGIQTRNER